MAYLFLVISIVYAAFWTLGLLLSLRSEGPKAPFVPAAGVLGFLALTFTSFSATSEAMSNPLKLTREAYNMIKEGMTTDEVTSAIGLPQSDPASIDLTEYRLSIPSAIKYRLVDGAFTADATPAKLTVKIFGEPSKRGDRRNPGLGSSAEEEANGLVGLVLVLTENENETVITEGEHWTYENGDTPEIVAKKIGDAIEETESWTAEGSPEDNPNHVKIESAIEENNGTVGNTMMAQVTTGKNTSVRVGTRNDGTPDNFRGGQDDVLVQVWFEKDVIMDANFTIGNRVAAIGYLGGKVSFLRESGIPD